MQRMKQASLTDLRRNLSTILNAVNNDHEPLVVTRRRGKPVVVISLEDYQAMDRPKAPVTKSDPAQDLLKALTEVDEIAFLPSARKDPT